MVKHELITLSSSIATRLTPNGIHSGLDITLQNVNSDGYIYVGGEGVSSSDYGYRISPNHAISFELPGQSALYAIASSSGLQVATLKTNLEAGS